MCDFGSSGVIRSEMQKYRHCICISPRSRKHTGNCLIVPLRNHRRELVAPLLQFLQQHPSVARRSEAAYLNPVLRLLVLRRPRRKIMRKIPPRHARAQHVARRVQHFPQRVGPLRRVFPARGQIRGQQRLFLIAGVARIGNTFAHALALPPFPFSS